MNNRKVVVTIDGSNIIVDVIGASGNECKEWTEFLTSAQGVSVQEETIKQEYKEAKVPAELHIG